MSFAFHSDVNDHPVFGALSLEAFGFWVRAGTWTSIHDSAGIVPAEAVAELWPGPGVGPVVDELVAAGAWSRIDGGYRMEYGPSADFPLPVWRYDEGEPANGMIEIIPDPDR